MKPPKPITSAPIPAGLGRAHRMDLDSARRTAAASKAAGFPVPAHIAELLDAVKTPATAAPATAVEDASSGPATDTKEPN